MEKIKELRNKTGAGISDCKKALEEAGGDIEQAVEILRKQGIAKAAKRDDRAACEGVIKVAGDNEGRAGYIVEINSETDFVARNDKFKEFTAKVVAAIKRRKPGNLDELLATALEGERTVKEVLDNLSGIIGEKLTISRYDILSSPDGLVEFYSHAGEKIGVLVSINTQNKELAHDLAMQIAAADPKYISSADVPAEETEKEKKIYHAQLTQEGKPAAIVEKIIAGKLEKYLAEVCLLEQEYIKDDSKKVKDILGDAKVLKFIRYSL